MKKVLKLEGLDCANCAAELENRINKVEGVENVSVSFMTQRLTFECNEEILEEKLKEIKKIIKKEEPDVEVEEI